MEAGCLQCLQMKLPLLVSTLFRHSPHPHAVFDWQQGYAPRLPSFAQTYHDHLLSRLIILDFVTGLSRMSKPICTDPIGNQL
ncbi:hypothetical protein E4U55_003638 [Claviceps digitariae]|nr:hypothetical protein E4U55_003638 [Claviceps digitariae]